MCLKSEAQALFVLLRSRECFIEVYISIIDVKSFLCIFIFIKFKKRIIVEKMTSTTYCYVTVYDFVIPTQWRPCTIRE